MRHIVRGIAVMVLIAVTLWFLWLRYSEVLTAGMRPTLGTQKLNQMEQGGVPDFELSDLSGKSVRLSSLKGKVIILSFWASWCDPCIEEFPSMVKLVEFFQGQVVMVAVSADKRKEDILSFLKPYGELPPHIMVLWDEKRSIAEQYGTEVLPESYILDQNMKVVRKVAGTENWFSPSALQLFQEILHREPSSQSENHSRDHQSKSK